MNKNIAIILVILLCGICLGDINQPSTAIKYLPAVSVADVNLHSESPASNTVAKYTGAGSLIGIGCTVVTAKSGTASPDIVLSITLDELSPTTVKLYSGAFSTFATDGAGAFATVSDGSHVGDKFFIPFNSAFTTSLLVTINSNIGVDVGTLRCGVSRGVKY